MNFLCHAIPYLDDPLVAIGTAVPDWLSATDRKIRARERLALAALESADRPTRQIAQGILHHIRDDRWFHTTAAFVETNLELAVALRERLPGDAGFRPMFVSHVTIEVLLDAFWIRDHPALAREYYAVIGQVPAQSVQRSVNAITGRPTDRLAATIERFAEARFLYDYLDPERLLWRLNQVMRRVGLEPLPPAVLPWIQQASDLVESRRGRFLTQPDGSTNFPPLP
jgi:hypothetical protein